MADCPTCRTINLVSGIGRLRIRRLDIMDARPMDGRVSTKTLELFHRRDFLPDGSRTLSRLIAEMHAINICG
jgi:hypothetical protein